MTDMKREIVAQQETDEGLSRSELSASTVKEIVSRRIESVTTDDTVAAAAAAMKEAEVGAIPVLDDQRRAVGILTDRDIVLRVVAERADPDEVLIGEVMTPGVISCVGDQTLAEAARIMEEHQVRRLLVLEDGSNRAIGIISLGDIAVHARRALAGEAIREVSKPSA